MSEIKWRNEANIDKPLMTLSREGLWVDPDIPADETARLVIAAIDTSIKFMVANAIADEREACAKFCEEQYEFYGYDHVFAKGIRARGEA